MARTYTKLRTILFAPRYGIFYRGPIPKWKSSYTALANGKCTNYLCKYHMPLTDMLLNYSTETNIKNKEVITKKPEPIVIKSDSLTRKDKLKKAVKEYGSTVIVFHVGISLISLGTCYILVSMGLDTTAFFNSLGLGNWASNSKIAANAGTFAVAYGIHKVFAPVRITITLASVPFIVRYLRKIGILKQ